MIIPGIPARSLELLPFVYGYTDLNAWIHDIARSNREARTTSSVPLLHDGDNVRTLCIDKCNAPLITHGRRSLDGRLATQHQLWLR